MSQAQRPKTEHIDYSAQAQILRSRIALVSSKQNTNPLMAKDPLDRQAGVYSLGKRILDNKVFQSQTSETKQSILRDYYKTYVTPAYTSSNLQPPDEDTWVKGMSIPGGPTMRVDDFYLNRANPDEISDFKATTMSMGAGFVRTAAQMIRGLTIGGIKVDNKLLGLGSYYNSTDVDKYMAAENVPGLAEKGNIPIWNRPVVKNDDGSHSSEYSVSFNQEGKEVLIPTVVDGRFLTPSGKKPKEGSPEEKEMFKTAWGHYLATGEHLGKFDSVDAANAYSNVLHNRGTRPDPDSWKAHYVKLLNKMADSGVMKASQDTISNIDFWFACRPSQKFSEMAGTFVGEQLAQLPLYQSIGLLGKAGLGAVGANKLMEASAATGKLARTANLTRRLATSPLGREVGKHLASASEGYIGGIVQGESSSDAKMDAISFAALGIISADLGNITKQLGGKALENATKKMFAEQAAVGGLPLVDANIKQAVHDLDHNVAGKGHDGMPLVVKPEDGPAAAQAAINQAKQADPIHHVQTTSTKGALLVHARVMYGKSWQELSQPEKDAVRAKVTEIATQAPQEISLHVQGVQDHAVKDGLKTSQQMSPQISQTLDFIHKNFPSMDLEGDVKKMEKKGTAAQEGVITSQGTAQQIVEDHQKVQDEKKKKPSGKDRPGDRTREDNIFSDFSDFGVSKYNHKDESFNIQFESKADRALYNTRKTPLQYGSVNKPVPPTYHATKAKLKQFFPEKTPQELQDMANQVKAKVDDAVKERKAHPDYKANKMKYGMNIRIPSIHGGSRAEQAAVMKEEVEDFAKTANAAKMNNPDVYDASLEALAYLQVLKQAEESSK